MLHFDEFACFVICCVLVAVFLHAQRWFRRLLASLLKLDAMFLPSASVSTVVLLYVNVGTVLDR